MLELDEVWSFVQKKANKSWLWIGLCQRTHEVVAYAVRSLQEYLAAITQALARTLERRRMSSAEIIRCASDLADLYAKCFPFPKSKKIRKHRSSYSSMSTTSLRAINIFLDDSQD